MAQKENTVFLGFEDEELAIESGESKANKIGGLPNWPTTAETIEIMPCSICGMKRPLILQLYAPLEQSLYHRTFYIFACLRPLCSQHAKSWTCLRIQYAETKASISSQTGKNKQKHSSGGGTKINWCNNLDDWGQESCDDKFTTTTTITMAIDEEENGNAKTANICRLDETDEEEDEDGNILMGQSLINEMSQLNMKQNKVNFKTEPNANCAAGLTLASVNDECTFAVIESEETDIVLAEAPIKPRANLRELLSTTTQMNFTDFKDVTLKSFYIAVDIEQPLEEYGNLSVEHIQEIYEKYKFQNDEGGECFGAAGGGDGGGGGCGENGGEAYENTIPLHGDAMFHKFVSTIKMNPTQILRYTRDTPPLLMEPLVEFDIKCKHCNGPTICEIQILSTLIPKLKIHATNQVPPIDFGNILIFTCLRSCWDTSDKTRYESIIVQKEK